MFCNLVTSDVCLQNRLATLKRGLAGTCVLRAWYADDVIRINRGHDTWQRNLSTILYTLPWQAWRDTHTHKEKHDMIRDMLPARRTANLRPYLVGTIFLSLWTWYVHLFLSIIQTFMLIGLTHFQKKIWKYFFSIRSNLPAICIGSNVQKACTSNNVLRCLDL